MERSNTYPVAVIDHAALRHNMALARKNAPKSKIWAVIKADAYGHGAAEIAKSLDSEGLAVARLAEARRLRLTEPTRPILVMGGVYNVDELHEAANLQCDLVVHNAIQGQMLIDNGITYPAKIWIKVNTGMNRLGFSLEEAKFWLSKLAYASKVPGPPGLMTHLACADNMFDALTLYQCERLQSIAKSDNLLSIGNSAGILEWSTSQSDWVRPGIMLYGISPFIKEIGSERNLLPVMTLYAQIIAVYQCPKGAAIGYGDYYRCTEPMTIGIVGIGYGDGYPRHVSLGAPVLVEGHIVPTVGRVSMDMLAVDLNSIPQTKIGTEVVLWGQGLPVEEVAKVARTIAYQLLTGVTNRVTRLHINC
ncbi:hypothetical protein TI04_05685 [Achromatium sp. WMS2]|nr:hypothetical protein TI04_05685 [Achromatium sp. WMS2]